MCKIGQVIDTFLVTSTDMQIRRMRNTWKVEITEQDVK